MLSRRLPLAAPNRRPFVCLLCSAQQAQQARRPRARFLSASAPRRDQPADAPSAAQNTDNGTPVAQSTPTEAPIHSNDASTEQSSPAEQPKGRKRRDKSKDGEKPRKVSQRARRKLNAKLNGLSNQPAMLLKEIKNIEAFLRTHGIPESKSDRKAWETGKRQSEWRLEKLKEALVAAAAGFTIKKIYSDDPRKAEREEAAQRLQEERESREAAKKAKPGRPKTLREAMMEREAEHEAETKARKTKKNAEHGAEAVQTLEEALLDSAQQAKTSAPLDIEVLSADDLDFTPVDHEIPPIPKLAYGLDRVLFNSGVYRLQDPRTRVYNFDPYLEKIMPVTEFDFDALSEYQTSSKDATLLAMTKKLDSKFTGSTSSMSGVLQHFHFLLSAFRPLNHDMLSRGFPRPSAKFSQITTGPTAVFLRWKNGVYAIDADKSLDSPNIMSWLGNSMERLLTTTRDEFERYRRSNPEAAPDETESGRCFHYSKLGNFLMRSQLDAQDARLPGTGVFDLKTRAVVSIRMDHRQYEEGSGYQLRYDLGMWESFEREFYDMTRATMLKYSLQVRMGRMDGIFVAYHNIERIFGFQYLPMSEMDLVLHGQTDPTLGDQEFKLSVSLLDEMLQRATKEFPEQSIRLHFDTIGGSVPFMYIFAEPVSEETADAIQTRKNEAFRDFERTVIGIQRDDPEVQENWQKLQDRVDEEVDEDQQNSKIDVREENEEDADVDVENAVEKEAEATQEAVEQTELEEKETAATTEETEEVAAEEPIDHTAPLLGWTLAIRNRINGCYVDRPSALTPADTWQLEYHIKEIAADKKWTLYNKLKQKRDKLLGEETQAKKSELSSYRKMIAGYSKRGRMWREEQDRIEKEMEGKGRGREVFRPMGPGSELL